MSNKASTTRKTNLPRGHFSKILAMDCETTGLNFNSPDPSDGYQSISWGLIVADAKTLKEIDSLYVEIQWDGQSIWEKRAEQVHGLSIEHLKKHGLPKDEAAAKIAEFVYSYWPPDAQSSANRNVRCAGHNVATFDTWFMRRLLNEFGVMFTTGNRFIDTSSVGWVMLDTYNSDDLFSQLGLGERTEHNALEDARMALQVLKKLKALSTIIIGE